MLEPRRVMTIDECRRILRDLANTVGWNAYIIAANEALHRGRVRRIQHTLFLPSTASSVHDPSANPVWRCILHRLSIDVSESTRLNWAAVVGLQWDTPPDGGYGILHATQWIRQINVSDTENVYALAQVLLSQQPLAEDLVRTMLI